MSKTVRQGFVIVSVDKFIEVNYTLSWGNVDLYITGANGKKIKVPFEVGADTLYNLSKEDKKLSFSLGQLFKAARKAAHLSQEQVAELAGTSRTYITKLESNEHDVEVMTFKKLVEAGLNKHISIEIK
jgi:DNA-binding XRE family transcriptional regulator